MPHPRLQHILRVAVTSIAALLCTGPAAKAQTLASPSPVSHWNQPIAASSVLDRHSERFVSALNRLVVADIAAKRGPWIDTGNCAIPRYIVGPEAPTTRVTLLNGTRPGRVSLQAALEAVPIPADAIPSKCRDQSMVIEQPSTDRSWELWHARQVDGRWHADFAGATNRLAANEGVFGPSDWPGAKDYWGVSASSMMLVDGLIRWEELQRGSIDHALALSVPRSAAKVWSAPAKRTDGVATSLDAIPYGARFRLDPRVDVERLAVPAVTKVLARAAQRYGIIVREQTHHNVQFATVAPPKDDLDVFRRIFGGLPGPAMRAFPWHRLQLLPMDLRGDGARISAIRR